MAENKVECNSLKDFAELISLFTSYGLKFRAESYTLTITITGY